MHRMKVIRLCFIFALFWGINASTVEKSLYAEEDYFASLSIIRFKKEIKAPEFTLKDLNGKDVSLKDFSGKVVFLTFWATWCGPCIIEMPSMEKLYRQFKDDGLIIVAINFQESRKQVKVFMDNFRLTFPALLDQKGEVGGLYGVFSLPTTYLIDPEGRLIGGAIGARDWEKRAAQELIKALLKYSVQHRLGE